MGDPDEEMKYPFLSLPNDENVFRWLSLLMMRIDRQWERFSHIINPLR